MGEWERLEPCGSKDKVRGSKTPWQTIRIDNRTPGYVPSAPPPVQESTEGQF